MTLSMLDREITYYEEHLAEWLTQYPGKIVVVKDQELIGVFDTFDDALAEGARRFGLNSFLVRRVEETQKEEYIPALTLGLLRADSSRPIQRSGPDS